MPSFSASWAAASGATGYDVEVAIGPEDFQLVSSNQAGLSYSYSHPTDGTTHQIRVTPRNGTEVGDQATTTATATQGATSTAWQTAVSALGPNLRGYWPITDPTGTTMTAVTGPSGTYQAVQAGWMSPVTSDPNRRHRFFDTNTYATIADVPALDLANSFSLVFALRRGTTGTGRYTLYDKGAGSIGVWIVNDKLTFGAVNAPSPITAETGTTADRNPHLVIVTWDGTTAKIWKDDTDVTGTVTPATLVDTATAVNIGRSSATATSWYSGALEVGVYSGVLTANQRTALSDGFTGNTTTPPVTPAAPPTGLGVSFNSGTGLITASWTADAGSVGYYVEEQIGPSPVWRRLNTTATAGVSFSWGAPQDSTVRKVRVISLAPDATETAPTSTVSTTLPTGTTSSTFRNALLALGSSLSYGWTMDEASGTTMTAVKGTAGTYGAADPTRVPAAGWVSPVPSDANRPHRYWDGVDDTAQVADETGLHLADGPMTFVVALRRDQQFSDGAVGTRYDTILSKNAGGVSLVLKGTKLTLYPAQTANFIVEESTTTPADATPTLFFVTKNGATATIHKATSSGALADVTHALGTFALTDTTNPLGFASGVNPLRNFYSGGLEVYICPVALTSTQRQTVTDAWRGVTAPSPPTSVTAVGSTDGSGNITVTWPIVSGASSYNVYRNGGATSVASVTQPGSGTTVTFLDTGRPINVQQSYTISTVASGVESTSAAGPATATATAPVAAPTLIVSPTSLALSTAAPVGSFQVLLSAAGGFTLVSTVDDIAITDAMILADPTSTYTITQSPGAGWLTVDSVAGSTPDTITVTASSAGLVAGQTYTGSLSVAVAGAAQSPQTVLVSYTIPALPDPGSGGGPGTGGGGEPEPIGTRWDLVLCDRNGTPLGQILNATGRTLRFALRGTPTLGFTVSTSHPLAPYMLQVDRMLVKAYENSTGSRILRFIGPVTSVERVRQSATGTLAVVATGPAWRLDRRLIGQTAPGATFGTTPLVLRDRGDMMAALVDALNVGDTSTIMCEANDTGIRRGFIRASSSTYVGPWLWKTAGSVLTDLSSSLDSPDWEVAPVEPLPDSVGVQIGRLNVQPVLGSDAPQAAWEYGTGRHNVQTFRDVLDANASANRAIALPPGYPDQTVGDIQVAADTDSEDDRGLLEALVEGDLIADELRRELAEQHIAVRKDPRRVVTFTPVAETPATEADRRVPRLFAEFNVGDFVPFRAVEPIEVWDEEGNIVGFEDRKTIDATFRVYGASVAIDDNGTAITDLTLVQEG